MPEKAAFCLSEISQWTENNLVALPTVQRGFVWRPAQIENLWDSLLRGYPVGSFVLSRNAGGHEILDGQQRATAICLGFAQKTFRQSEKHVRVFIDLEKPGPDDDRKYFFRVITRSHPWGYQRNENISALTTDNIRKAMDKYDIDGDTLDTDLDHYFPYDAGFPLPYHYFLDAIQNHKDVDHLYASCRAWEHWEKIMDSWCQNHPENTDAESHILNRIAVIYEATAKMLCEQSGQRIPALYMDLDQLLADDEEEHPEATDEIENLFIRLNAGGTQLTGEELNYSILKAHLSRDTQNIIEEACKTLFRPSRFITIAYRLFLVTRNSFEGKDNQVHTRSLHAEENAMLQITKYGGQGIKGGHLFTTASPCELCSKKAFQLGIAKIYYIDPYPGIAASHILKNGTDANSFPKLLMFQGAVGRAFHKLFEPFMAFKDELNILTRINSKLIVKPKELSTKDKIASLTDDQELQNAISELINGKNNL